MHFRCGATRARAAHRRSGPTEMGLVALRSLLALGSLRGGSRDMGAGASTSPDLGVIVEPGSGMGKICRTLGRQDLGPAAILGQMQGRHARRVLLMLTLHGRRVRMMRIHGHALGRIGLIPQATLTTIETDA
jgi:hypothetical protein